MKLFIVMAAIFVSSTIHAMEPKPITIFVLGNKDDRAQTLPVIQRSAQELNMHVVLKEVPNYDEYNDAPDTKDERSSTSDEDTSDEEETISFSGNFFLRIPESAESCIVRPLATVLALKNVQWKGDPDLIIAANLHQILTDASIRCVQFVDKNNGAFLCKELCMPGIWLRHNSNAGDGNSNFFVQHSYHEEDRVTYIPLPNIDDSIGTSVISQQTSLSDWFKYDGVNIYHNGLLVAPTNPGSFHFYLLNLHAPRSGTTVDGVDAHVITYQSPPIKGCVVSHALDYASNTVALCKLYAKKYFLHMYQYDKLLDLNGENAIQKQWLSLAPARMTKCSLTSSSHGVALDTDGKLYSFVAHDCPHEITWHAQTLPKTIYQYAINYTDPKFMILVDLNRDFYTATINYADDGKYPIIRMDDVDGALIPAASITINQESKAPHVWYAGDRYAVSYRRPKNIGNTYQESFDNIMIKQITFE